MRNVNITQLFESFNSNVIMFYLFFPVHGHFTEMCSFSELKVDKCLAPAHVRSFIRNHSEKFTRVYPKGARVDSSNYDPVKLWNLGIQLVALNYQTPDKAMQLNNAKFRQHGNCGYVLRPDFMFADDYDPSSLSSLGSSEPLTFHLKVCLSLSVRCFFKFHPNVYIYFSFARLSQLVTSRRTRVKVLSRLSLKLRSSEQSMTTSKLRLQPFVSKIFNIPLQGIE